MKHLLYLFLVLSIVSCKTVKTIPVETVKTSVRHDTLIMNHQWYDSIYVFQDRYIDRSKDTVYSRELQLQYKYKILRDTIYKSKTDSIPVIKTVEVEKQVKYIPWYAKTLAWIGAICLLIFALYIVYKITKVYIAK